MARKKLKSRSNVESRAKPMRRAPFFMGVGDWGGQTPYGREYRDCRVAKGGVPERCLNRHEYVCVMEFIGLVANKFPKFFYALHPGTTPWEGYDLLPSKVQPHHNPGHNELEPGRLYECRMGAEIRSTATTVCDDEENDDGSKKISLLKLAQSRHFYIAEDDIRNLEICHTLVREKVPVEEIAAKYGISVYEVCHVRHCINDMLWHFRRHARW